ncbi:hypothetical protein VTJ49DRAFT_360 [Mycothermus thermophilus]|uniref:Uncharacterized protein n=1 Tax=Humicola insolens TaxID=85995 RepID=A0ABR3VFB5_HUMIN
MDESFPSLSAALTQLHAKRTSEMSLYRKTAVITGASGGIGLAIAKRFAKEGACIILAGRNEEKLERARIQVQEVKLERPEWESEGRPTHSMISAFDVSQIASWKKLLDQHVQPKQIDILVNCAGVTQRSLLLGMNPDDIDELLNVNLRGAILGCKMVGKRMAEKKYRLRTSSDGKNKPDGWPSTKCIINISSLLAHRAMLGTSVYTATKAGLLGLTTSLSQEFARFGIRVNAIVPGYIETEMTRDMANDLNLLGKIPLGRFGTPEEVADAAVFLAKNEYANNCIINLDGGLSAVI